MGHQRPDRRIFVAFEQGGVVIGSDQTASPHEFLPQQPVIDIKSQSLARGMQIRAINEKRKPFVMVKHHSKIPYKKVPRQAMAAPGLQNGRGASHLPARLPHRESRN